MGYSETLKLKVVAEYEKGGVSFCQLQRKYHIPGNSTIQKWVKRYGKSGIGGINLNNASNTINRVEAVVLRKELEMAKIKIAALEALVDASSRLTGIDLKKKFGGK